MEMQVTVHQQSLGVIPNKSLPKITWSPHGAAVNIIKPQGTASKAVAYLPQAFFKGIKRRTVLGCNAMGYNVGGQ